MMIHCFYKSGRFCFVKFESFCEIREEAPNYQRNYEFFVDRFTQLCHYNSKKNKTKCVKKDVRLLHFLTDYRVEVDTHSKSG
jgi:hypothetical protein